MAFCFSSFFQISATIFLSPFLRKVFYNCYLRFVSIVLRNPFTSFKVSPLKNAGTGIRNSPIKMKPKPIGFDFAEVDARKILKPFSHDKYIHEPDYDTVVYISRCFSVHSNELNFCCQFVRMLEVIL